jgi:hypothetical protein
MAEDFSDQFLKDNVVRLCAKCVEEQKIDQNNLVKNGWKFSHGKCMRHLTDDMKIANIPDEMIRKFVEKPRAEKPIRDLKDPKNEPLLQWLNNPPQAK